MKKEFVIGILGILFITLVAGVSALCQNSQGYYDDCSKVNGYYDNYGTYYMNSNYNYNSNYNSNYNYGGMDSCRDSRGNYYPCYKQYRINPNHDNDYNSDYYDNHYYDNDYNNYYSNNRRISVNYRDSYGNYVTEIRPDYTRRYCQDDWNLPWHLRSYSNCYDSYDPVYNNPYYPDYYINQNTQNSQNMNSYQQPTAYLY